MSFLDSNFQQFASQGGELTTSVQSLDADSIYRGGSSRSMMVNSASTVMQDPPLYTAPSEIFNSIYEYVDFDHESGSQELMPQITTWSPEQLATPEDELGEKATRYPETQCAVRLPSPSKMPQQEQTMSPRSQTTTQGSGSQHEMDPESSPRQSQTTIQRKKVHSVIEKRYREKIKDKLSQLHQILVETRQSTGLPIWGRSVADWSTSKVPKSEIIQDAITYILSSDAEIRRLRDEILRLSARLEYLETYQAIEINPQTTSEVPD